MENAMGVATSLARLTARFLRHQRGNFGMIAAIIAPVLLLAVGYGVNSAQVALTRSNLLAALDAAVTSTARDLTTGTITEKDAPKVVEAFLIANGLRGFAEEGRLTLDSLAIDRLEGTVTAQASVELDVAFALFGAANRQKVTAGSAAIYSAKKVEVAMMLDLTGSMKKSGSTDKLGDLQRAARSAVTTLLGKQDPDKPRVRIALIPYANSVNVGSLAPQSVYVEQKVGDRGKVVSNVDPKNVTTNNRPDNCATERVGARSFEDVGPEVQMVNRDFFLTDFSNGNAGHGKSVVCPSATLVPLTADRTKLNNTINAFVADGGTGGHMGIQWAWYMLSDKWKNVVGAAAAPGPYKEQDIAKYAILMTDGEFNLGFLGATTAKGAYGTAAANRSIPHAKRLCEEMRKAGIEIFTVGFYLPNAAARDVMSSCASSPRYFFDTANGNELNAAFVAIARNIEKLALTK